MHVSPSWSAPLLAPSDWYSPSSHAQTVPALIACLSCPVNLRVTLGITLRRTPSSMRTLKRQLEYRSLIQPDSRVRGSFECSNCCWLLPIRCRGHCHHYPSSAGFSARFDVCPFAFSFRVSCNKPHSIARVSVGGVRKDAIDRCREC